jgi:hypothetical protein
LIGWVKAGGGLITQNKIQLKEKEEKMIELTKCKTCDEQINPAEHEGCNYCDECCYELQMSWQVK